MIFFSIVFFIFSLHGVYKTSEIDGSISLLFFGNLYCFLPFFPFLLSFWVSNYMHVRLPYWTLMYVTLFSVFSFFCLYMLFWIFVVFLYILPSCMCINMYFLSFVNILFIFFFSAASQLELYKLSFRKNDFWLFLLPLHPSPQIILIVQLQFWFSFFSFLIIFYNSYLYFQLILILFLSAYVTLLWWSASVSKRHYFLYQLVSKIVISFPFFWTDKVPFSLSCNFPKSY